MKAPKSKILSITAIIVAFLAMACSLVNARYYAKLVTPPPRSSHYYHQLSYNPLSLVSEMMSAPMYFSSTTKEQQQQPRVEVNTPSERSGPRYSVSEENGMVQLEMEIPGVYAKDIEINLEDEKILRIKGRRTYKPSRNGSTDQTEFDVTFRLKENVDTSQLKANLAAGILRVQVPNKAKEMKRIPIGFDGGDEKVAIAVPNDRDGEHRTNVSTSQFDASTEETVNGITISACQTININLDSDSPQRHTRNIDHYQGTMNSNGPSLRSTHENSPHCGTAATSDGMDNSLFVIGTSEKKGRGLFAAIDIPPFTILHSAPCIVVPKVEYEIYAKHTIFEHYLFNDTVTGDKLLALGYGSLFNHDSRRPNVIYRIHSAPPSLSPTIEYKSGAQMIPQGSELCISYGSNLWFDDHNDDDDGIGGTKRNDHGTDDDDATAEFLQRMEC